LAIKVPNHAATYLHSNRLIVIRIVVLRDQQRIKDSVVTLFILPSAKGSQGILVMGLPNYLDAELSAATTRRSWDSVF
jgi:hypothetical protein